MAIQQMMLGTAGPAFEVNWPPVFANDFRGAQDFNEANAAIGALPNGKVTTANSTTGTQNFADWLISGDAADFSVSASLVSGTPPLGSALNTWISMSTGAQYMLVTNSGNLSCTLNVTLRHNPSGQTWSTTWSISVSKGTPI